MVLSKIRLIYFICNSIFAIAIIMFSTFATAEDWQWQITAGQLKQDYQESDSSGLTQDGVLNTETGSMPVIEVSVNNTLETNFIIGKELTPYGELSLLYARGETDYEGYLQSGLILTPYNTVSDNEFIQLQYDLGFSHELSQAIDITPLLAISHQRWERELEQYTEDFNHTAMLAGANIDWQPNSQIPLTLQLQAKMGKIVDSAIDVPKLGLKQEVGNPSITQWGLVAQYQLSDQWDVMTSISQQKFEYKESDIQNGYQYPDSESEQTLWQLGLGYRF